MKTSIARKLASLRTFFQFLVREGVLETNPAKLVATPKIQRKLPTHLSIEDAIRFIETPDLETDLGRRDRAILGIYLRDRNARRRTRRTEFEGHRFPRKTRPRYRKTQKTKNFAVRRTRAAIADVLFK